MLKIFNKIFRKDVSYDIKSHKKAEFYTLSRKHIFRKTTGGSQIDAPVFLGLISYFVNQYDISLCTIDCIRILNWLSSSELNFQL